ncbi:hypothetical protein SEA_AVAZAK_36 [Gordonia phage Avazak]|uniref:Uncharacterized protein n=1 Tax=Gordonia phage Avazak TaxID=2656529 RepID=A0A649V6L2_9CAUD|nr:hypothetical protein HWC78_gp36 [Gordonia phage Avazak]QGJ88018.1 hypothetical protein SEA_AVAZAK_36 [Gordonia phage Avazak]
MTTSEYYYGDGTDNVVRLTEKQAWAVNNILIIDTIVDHEDDESIYVKTNLNEEQMKDYSEAADILNAYLEDHDVFYENPDQPMLRPVE